MSISLRQMDSRSMLINLSSAYLIGVHVIETRKRNVRIHGISITSACLFNYMMLCKMRMIVNFFNFTVSMLKILKKLS